jgi:hypothetical protein
MIYVFESYILFPFCLYITKKCHSLILYYIKQKLGHRLELYTNLNANSNKYKLVSQ